MTAVMEFEPAMMPTIVRRVGSGGLETLERIIDDGEFVGERALCVFWSVEHAERDMYANGRHPEDGWKAIERDHEELAQVFEVLSYFDRGAPRFAYVEPAPGTPELCALLEAADLIEMLRECAEE